MTTNNFVMTNNFGKYFVKASTQVAQRRQLRHRSPRSLCRVFAQNFPSSRVGIITRKTENNFGECVVAICDTRLGVGNYTVGCVSQRA